MRFLDRDKTQRPIGCKFGLQGPPLFLKKGLALFYLLCYPNMNIPLTLIHMIDKAFIEEMRQALLAEQKRLQEELSRFSHRNPKSDQEVDFPVLGDKEDENAAEVAQFSDNLSLEDELEHALRDVESAFKVIEGGKYGLCKYCNQLIDERRLRARPTSSSCINCKKTLTQEM